VTKRVRQGYSVVMDDFVTSAASAVPVELIERIHAAPAMMVMEFAGAGAQALWWLHSVAGSSRTVLEATDRYVPAALIGAVGFVPERFTSPEVAAALALSARRRSRQLAAPETPTFGLGLTAAIATDRAKRGEHRCEVAVRDAFGSTHYGLLLEKGGRSRGGEEATISLLALRAVADASGVLGASLPPLMEGDEMLSGLAAAGSAAEFGAAKREWLMVTPAGETGDELPAAAAILSGAFNPVHRGHLRLAEAAERRLGVPVLFELPLVNAEKDEIELAEARRRANQFLGRSPVLLTRAPLFNQKARLFPGRTYVIGVDTAARLLDRRFYGSDERRDQALAELRDRGARFLVAGRRDGGRFQTLADLDLPASGHGLFDGLSEDEFREDLSSSRLRREWDSSASASG
jgi:hypothetical protein